jgi:hypothetical protein
VLCSLFSPFIYPSSSAVRRLLVDSLGLGRIG